MGHFPLDENSGLNFRTILETDGKIFSGISGKEDNHVKYVW